MKAIVIDEPGAPDCMNWRVVDDVHPGPGEVRIRVAATAVNRADTLQRMGRYDVPPGVSPILGLECSGVVDEVGPGTTGWAVGDRVCALLDGGGYAEQVVVAATQVLPLPDGVGMVEAAALPEVACTAWSNLVMVGRVTTGDDVLIHGGGSGIGTFAVQLLAALGARALVTAGSEAKLEACRRLGAAVTVNYQEQDFVEATRAATNGRGADLILDNMGGLYLSRNLDSLADDGRLITIGLQGGAEATIDLRQMLLRRLTLHVTTLRSRPARQKADVVHEVAEHVWPLIGTGRIAPVVDCALPVADAREAHALLERSEHTGKVILIVEQSEGS